MSALTDRDITRILRSKTSYRAAPIDCRRSKIKMRFKGRYEEELRRTLEKVAILQDLIESGAA